jgi:hypothetical protein
MVIEYSNLTFHEVLDLPLDTFYLMFKHAYVNKLMQTKEGQEYLENCKRYSTTKPDKAKLRERFKKGGR